MSHPPHRHSHDTFRTRLAMAEEDLRAAEDVHLATASSACLIATIEKLRGSLADMIRLVREHGPE